MSIQDTSSELLAPLNTLWARFSGKLRESVPPVTYNTWFQPLKPFSLDGNKLTIQLPNSFYWEWIEEHYRTLMRATAEEILGAGTEINYMVVEEHQPRIESTVAVKPEVVPVTAAETELPAEGFSNNLNPKYTFENFIKGEGNQLARAAAGAIADNPGGTSFNPFYIYGGVGLGKTHLAQSIGNEILKRAPSTRIVYVSSEKFTTDFVDAIQANKAKDFSNFYRSVDMLIIDDIQFLSGKEKTQDLFFHIFNTLHQSRRQIILTSDKPPREIKGMDDRLISRFHWGLTADIQPPDLETRIAILHKKAQSMDLEISEDLLEYIATHVTKNIRELEGCLVRLLANISFGGREITSDLVKRTVKEISTAKRVNISIELITRTVCESLKIDENKVRDKTRKAEVVEARQLAMFLSKDMTKSSLKVIGLHFGGRDHSTVIHSCESVEKRLASDRVFRETVDAVRSRIEMAIS